MHVCLLRAMITTPHTISRVEVKQTATRFDVRMTTDTAKRIDRLYLLDLVRKSYPACGQVAHRLPASLCIQKVHTLLQL